MNPGKLKFGDFELDVAGYELSRDGRSIKLERIPMELLLLLVDRSGQLVARDDILERLWGRDVFLDVDNSINTAISKIRVALRDDPENPAFIKTVSGKGYRFIAPITVLLEGKAASTQSAETERRERKPSAVWSRSILSASRGPGPLRAAPLPRWTVRLPWRARPPWGRPPLDPFPWSGPDLALGGCGPA